MRPPPIADFGQILAVLVVASVLGFAVLAVLLSLALMVAP